MPERNPMPRVPVKERALPAKSPAAAQARSLRRPTVGAPLAGSALKTEGEEEVVIEQIGQRWRVRPACLSVLQVLQTVDYSVVVGRHSTVRLERCKRPLFELTDHEQGRELTIDD